MRKQKMKEKNDKKPAVSVRTKEQIAEDMLRALL